MASCLPLRSFTHFEVIFCVTNNFLCEHVLISLGYIPINTVAGSYGNSVKPLLFVCFCFVFFNLLRRGRHLGGSAG